MIFSKAISSSWSGADRLLDVRQTGGPNHDWFNPRARWATKQCWTT